MSFSFSTSFLFRCMPNFVEKSAENVFKGTAASTFAEEVIADLELAWKEILYMCLTALGKLYFPRYSLCNRGCRPLR